jgi:hypothetical protein
MSAMPILMKRNAPMFYQFNFPITKNYLIIYLFLEKV